MSAQLAEVSDSNMVTLHLYRILNEKEGIGIYTESITQSRLAELPKYYSTFAPPLERASLGDIYFDGRGWTSGPKLESITPEMIASALHLKYARLHQEEVDRLNETNKIFNPFDQEVFEFTYQQAVQAQQGKVLPFRLMLACEQKPNATAEDANALSDELVEDRIRQVIAKYRYMQLRKAAIIGKYRFALSTIPKVATTVSIVREMLHGHGG
jgi:hypothetical protein